MQLTQLRYFIAVAETGSFTRGAQLANVVQSAASAAVGSLERELKVELFERRGRAIQLTAAGAALLPHAYALQAQAQAARDAMNAERGVLRGEVTLGTLVHPGPIDILRVVGYMRDTHPQVVLKLRQTVQGTESSLAAVRSGALDLALVSSPLSAVRGVDLIDLHSEPYVFVHQQDRQLGSTKYFSLAEVSGESFVDFPDGWGSRRIIDALFATHQLERRVSTEVVSFDMALEFVRSGLGVAFVPKSTLGDGDGGGLRAHELTDVHWPVQLAQSSERPLSAAAQAVSRAVVSASSQ